MRSDERAAIDAVLEHWPLRSYTYKYGHWVYDRRIPLWYWPIALVTDIAVTRKSWKRSYTTFAICDPATGAALGVMDWRLSGLPGRRLLAAHHGDLEFAGDPRYLGVLKTGSGRNPYRLVFAAGMSFPVAVRQAHEFAVRPPGANRAEPEIQPANRISPRRGARFRGKANDSPWIADLPY